ncbi:MAG TPA: Gfo/Idh/MocA family oxidoreductase [Thermomicrobiales bacterium]|nr:Gfo/Idh/MocA family oxidoreductase [Thermomicrobiales bacterium]
MSSSEAPPRVGIVGVGAIGMTHVRAWQANGVTPAAIAELNEDALKRVAGELGAKPFQSAADMIASGEIDVVSLCTPPFTHQDLVERAIEADLAIVCEKPLAHTLESAEAIQRMVSASGTLLTVGFCHRFQPQVEVMRQMIADGAIGTPMMFRNRFAGHKADAATTWFSNPAMAGGGPMMDTSVHSVDLFRHLMGDAVYVSALTSTRETELGPALETEDTAAMLLQSADGTIGVIESSWRTPVPEWRVTIHGTGGALDLDYSTLTLRHCPMGGEWANVAVPGGDRFTREIAHFIEVWRGNADLRVTVEDGVAANRILDAAYRAASNPTRITIP